MAIESTSLPRKPWLRGLGFDLDDHGKASQWLNRCKAQVTQLTHIIVRQTGRRPGLREHDIVHLVESLIYTRILYPAIRKINVIALVPSSAAPPVCHPSGSLCS